MNLMRTDIQVLKNMLAAADRWQKELSGPKWIGTVASERDLLRDADRIIHRLEEALESESVAPVGFHGQQLRSPSCPACIEGGRT